MSTHRAASSESGPQRGAKVTVIEGTAVPVRGNDIDTDRIIPARFLKVVRFDGLGEHAFADVRYNERGEKTDHPFNAPEHAGASILMVNKNFGCGSSREHAPQALMRWGIKAIVGESFAEIFAGNCNALGMPAVTVREQSIETLMEQIEADPELRLVLDLESKTLRAGSESHSISMPETYRQALVAGTWDSTSQLLANEVAIRERAAALPYTHNFSA